MKNVHASELGKLGGASKSPKKLAAIRRNLRKANAAKRAKMRLKRAKLQSA